MSQDTDFVKGKLEMKIDSGFKMQDSWAFVKHPALLVFAVEDEDGFRIQDAGFMGFRKTSRLACVASVLTSMTQIQDVRCR
jgi:hypothetical protein